MAGDLGTTASGIQLTLTACLIGLGLGQLFLGPLSDAVGRRRPLLIGSFVCLLASIVCALAPNIEVLTAARFVQGLSGAAGVVLARAIVSDITRGTATAKLLGALMIINVIAPVIAPLAGGAIIASIGWRAVFWVLAALALIMFLGVLTFASESLPEPERIRGGQGDDARRPGSPGQPRLPRLPAHLLLRVRRAVAYISASPFVVQNVMGLSAGSYSLIFGLNALVITITSAVAAALAGRVAYRSMIAAGLAVGVLTSACLLVAALNGAPTVPTLLLFAIFQGSMGFVLPNTTALALQETGKNAGTGSAFLGFLQFTLAAVVSPLVGLMGEGTAVPMALAMITSIVLSSIVLSSLAFVLFARKKSSPQNSVEVEHEPATAVRP